MDRVLAAMERHDPDGAAEAMRQHIGNIATSYEAVPSNRAEKKSDAA